MQKNVSGQQIPCFSYDKTHPGFRKEVLGKNILLLEHLTIPEVIIVLCTSLVAIGITLSALFIVLGVKGTGLIGSNVNCNSIV
jgi:hypothetical protein